MLLEAACGLTRVRKLWRLYSWVSYTFMSFNSRYPSGFHDEIKKIIISWFWQKEWQIKHFEIHFNILHKTGPLSSERVAQCLISPKQRVKRQLPNPTPFSLSTSPKKLGGEAKKHLGSQSREKDPLRDWDLIISLYSIFSPYSSPPHQQCSSTIIVKCTSKTQKSCKA